MAFDVFKFKKMVKSSAYRYLLELEKRGIISYKGKRTLESPLQRKMKCSFCSIPLLGRIICGTPDEQEEYVKEYYALPEDWIDGECFWLEVYGDSMVDIGIGEGDFVLVKRAETAKDFYTLTMVWYSLVMTTRKHFMS